MKLLEIARSPKHSGDVRRKVDISHSLLPLVSEDVRRAGTLGEPPKNVCVEGNNRSVF